MPDAIRLRIKVVELALSSLGNQLADDRPRVVDLGGSNTNIGNETGTSTQYFSISSSKITPTAVEMISLTGTV